jgi:hypothetical protein
MQQAQPTLQGNPQHITGCLFGGNLQAQTNMFQTLQT